MKPPANLGSSAPLPGRSSSPFLWDPTNNLWVPNPFASFSPPPTPFLPLTFGSFIPFIQNPQPSPNLPLSFHGPLFKPNPLLPLDAPPPPPSNPPLVTPPPPPPSPPPSEVPSLLATPVAPSAEAPFKLVQRRCRRHGAVSAPPFSSPVCCFMCLRPGHFARSCSANVVCRGCGKEGHLVALCPTRRRYSPRSPSVHLFATLAMLSSGPDALAASLSCLFPARH